MDCLGLDLQERMDGFLETGETFGLVLVVKFISAEESRNFSFFCSYKYSKNVI